MQNVVNLHCPFLVGGNPIVNGRVYFVKVGTDAQTFNQVAGLDDAFFITVYDKDGNALENPLSLDSEGCFSVQPFVDDDTDFKMIVCRPTGISPDLEDDTAAWAVAYTMVSKSQRITVDYQGIAKVDSISALRLQDCDVGAVLVLGYNEANDFCPPRIFTWKQETLTDNGGTHIRSTKQGQQNAGTWICEPSHHVDVRWFGVEPCTASNFTDCWTTLNNIVSTYYPSMPLYLRRGYYNISGNLTINSGLILDNGSKIRPLGRSVTLTINNLDNRGGTFMRARENEESPYYNVYPKVNGELRSSWLSDPGEQISNDILGNVTELVFDSDTNFGTDYTISQKRILLKKGVDLQHALFEKCQVYYEGTAILSLVALLAERLAVDGKASISAETAHSENGLDINIVKNGDIVKVLEIFESLSTFFSGLKAEYLLVGEEDGENFQNGWFENGDIFEGDLALISKLAYIKELAFINSLQIGNGISHAKSSRKMISVVYIYNSGNPYVTVSVDGDEYTVQPENDGSFDLNVEDSQSNLVDIFEGARDFDMQVFGMTGIELKLRLPVSAGEKIVKVDYEANGLSGISDTLELYYYDNHGQVLPVLYRGQSDVNLLNGFRGSRMIRKTDSSREWFFDPFTI